MNRREYENQKLSERHPFTVQEFSEEVSASSYMWLMEFSEEVSASFCEFQLNWSTREKECYGVYFGVKTFEDLLDNRHFILKTDHMNLYRFFIFWRFILIS